VAQEAPGAARKVAHTHESRRLTPMQIASTTAVAAAAPAPAPSEPLTGIDGMVLRWEQRGPFQHNWDASVHASTDKAGTKLEASVDTNGLFVRAHTTDDTSHYGKAAETAVATTFLQDVNAKAGTIMSTLPSNVTKDQFEANHVRPGEYALSFDVAGTSKDYYYVGLLKTAPQGVLDLLKSAQDVRGHL
jgi:hypothetical protein